MKKRLDKSVVVLAINPTAGQIETTCPREREAGHLGEAKTPAVTRCVATKYQTRIAVTVGRQEKLRYSDWSVRLHEREVVHVKSTHHAARMSSKRSKNALTSTEPRNFCHIFLLK